MRHIRFLALAFLCIPALVAGQSSAQQPQPPKPTFRTGADFIRVDVFATKDGTPVHDLQRDDFEVLEDNRPQKVETFEHVLIRGGGPQETRVEPNTVRDAQAMAGDPRARVFALFLDAHHVTIEGGHTIKRPIIAMVDRMLAPEDLIGVMTPYDSARDLTLARKTIVLQRILEKQWDWGERDRITSLDPKDDKYRSCYPKDTYGNLAQDLTDRRREKETLDALRDLVIHLSGIREERKAILVVSDGWTLFRPDDSITRLRNVPGGGQEPVPGRPPIGVGPGGKITAGGDPRQNQYGASQTDCERDRALLSRIDDERDFRDLIDLANRVNASFYTIDPRGLVVFDTSIGSDRFQEGLIADQTRLRSRLESLRTIAGATDGMAVVDSNDIAGGLRKLSDDLTSYYLLGYYSPAGTDGKYHSITVRVKRPGISVRARRGYRAAKPEEVVAATTAVAASSTPNPVVDVLASLATIRQGVRLHLRAATGPGGDNALTVIGELDSSVRSEWSQGGTALVEILPRDGGRRVAAEEATFAAGKGAFMTTIGVPAGLTAPVYTVRVRVRPLETGGAPIQDSLDVSIARLANGAIQPQPVLFRRGPTTGVEYAPSADPRFRRADRVRLELTLPAGAASPNARLLDRTGKPLAVPITVRAGGAGGEGKVIGDLTLAPLSQGDYIIELSYEAGGAAQRTLTPFRLVP